MTNKQIHFQSLAAGSRSSLSRDGVSSTNTFFFDECIQLFLAAMQTFNTYNPWLRKLCSFNSLLFKDPCLLFILNPAHNLIWCYYFYWKKKWIKWSLHIFSMLLPSTIPLSCLFSVLSSHQSLNNEGFT